VVGTLGNDLREDFKTVANEGVTFLEGKCLSFSRGVAYHPVIDILKSTFDISSPLVASRRLQSKE